MPVTRSSRIPGFSSLSIGLFVGTAVRLAAAEPPITPAMGASTVREESPIRAAVLGGHLG